jgi:hypothetical protein
VVVIDTTRPSASRVYVTDDAAEPVVEVET